MNNRVLSGLLLLVLVAVFTFGCEPVVINPPLSSNCPECNYRGWHTTEEGRDDCPACDFNADGNATDINDITKYTRPKRYVYLCSCVAGLVSAGIETGNLGGNLPDNPEPGPGPDPDVVLTKDCENCKGRGWIGDGRPQYDCIVCDSDTPPDGNPLEPDSKWTRGDFYENFMALAANAAEEDEPADSEITWLTNSSAALAMASATNKSILVLLTDEPDKQSWDSILVQEQCKDLVCLLGDVSNKELAHEWASRMTSSPLVVQKDGLYSFKEDICCIINSEGIFLTDYQSCKGDALDVAETIERLLEEAETKAKIMRK